MEKKSKKILLDIGKGIFLIVLIWIINVFIAFVPFSVESNTRQIIWTWLIVDALLIYFLYRKKYFNWVVVLSAVGSVLILVLFYFLPLDSNIPESALELNNKIAGENENKYEYAKELFFEVEKKYTSPIRQYLLEPWKVFWIKDFEYFWNLPEGDYVDSNIQGRVYRKLLFESGRFSKEEVTIHQSFCSNSPHLLVKIEHPEREPIWVDFWAVDNFPGVESDETYEFGMRTIRPCDKLVGVGY
tara:strand:+ start:17028 stop:17756 length:729 start_codon:yes stop_codon:yes gene_type:complete